MTYEEFKNKYNGVGVDWDGHYGAQCVDLARFYIHEVWEVFQFPPVVGAKDIWEAIDESIYTKIPNSPEGVPEKGDVIVWDGRMGGGYGHVGIFDRGDVNQFWSFDQNWPTGTPSSIQYHKNYYAVKGWFRKTGYNDSMIYKGIDLSNTDSVKAAIDTWKDVIDGEYVRKAVVDSDYVSLEKYEGLEKKYNQLSDESAKLTSRIESIEASLKNVPPLGGSVSDKIQHLRETIEQSDEKMQQALDQQASMLEREKEESIKRVVEEAVKTMEKGLFYNLKPAQLIGFGILKLLGSDLESQKKEVLEIKDE